LIPLEGAIVLGKSKKREKQQKARGLSGFFAQTTASLFIISLNAAAFWFVHFTSQGRQHISELILFPGNLIQGKVWCLLTSGFVHYDRTHLLLNMLGLFVFGYVVQKKMGFAKTLFIYFGSLLISMLCATVVYAVFLHRSVAIIGASGAVMGLMGVAVLIAPFSITYEMLFPVPTMIKGWLFLWADLKGFLGGENDGISHLTHLFGFASVIILVYFLSDEDKRNLTLGLMANIVSLAVCVWLKVNYF